MKHAGHTLHRPICITFAALALTAACSSSEDPSQKETTTGNSTPGPSHGTVPGTIDVRHPRGGDASTEDGSTPDASTADAPSNQCCGGVLCGSACRDLNRDHANCGACVNACNADQVCTG